MKDLSKIFVGPADSIKAALDKMAENKPKETMLPSGIVLVVDKEKRLLGIATDGDIRRALAKDAKLASPIKQIMNRSPFLIEGQKSNVEILSLVADKIKRENWHKDRLDKIIVIDKNKKVADLISFYDIWQQNDVRFKHVGIVGLGFVGLTLGMTLADLGFKVKGFDKDKNVLDAVNKGKPHFFESGLGALIKDHLGKNFKVVQNFIGENNCDIYFVAVGTPLSDEKKPDLKYLMLAAKNLGASIKYGDLVVLRSTVPVGTTREVFAKIIEEVSGLKAGEEFFISFAPERTIEGKAIEELRRLPQVVGGINHKSAELAASVFSFMTKAVILVDSLEEAEMIKLINNTYRDVTFAFANEVALVSQRWGIDAKRVIEAANYGYERSNVPMPSPGVGGYCLEKDPYIFIDSARAKGYDPLLFHHARNVSETMVDFVAENIFSFIKNNKPAVKNPKIFTMGLAFKGRPITSDLRGSTSIQLIKKLQKENYKNIYGYDPAVPRAHAASHGIKFISNPEAGFSDADVVVVMTNHQLFEDLNVRKLLSLAKKPTFLFDTWGIFKKEELSRLKGIHYKRL